MLVHAAYAVHAVSSLELHTFYPTLAPPGLLRLGPYEIEAAREAPLAPGPHPLVVISHGSGGTPLTHRGLALHLARAGFLAVLPLHPGDHRDDKSLTDSPQNLLQRPAHLRAALDWAHHHFPVSAAFALGHSLGAYTILCAAGAHSSAIPAAAPPDPRLRALVLLAPATPWFQAPHALARVQIPILLYTGAQDTITSSWHAQILTRGLPPSTPLTHVDVPLANHYSFLAPFPPALCRPGFAPGLDAPGFDRPAFHQSLYAHVTHFFSTHRP